MSAYQSIPIPFAISLLLYLIFGMGYLINNYLISSIDQIAKILKIRKNEFFFGVLLAICNSIPEFSTNILSCFAKEKEMVNYGFGTIVGSGVFGNKINSLIQILPFALELLVYLARVFIKK